jgi:hypothetical protein
MADGFKLATLYNSDLLSYCVNIAFFLTRKLVLIVCYFLFILGLFNEAYNSLHYIMCNDNE